VELADHIARLNTEQLRGTSDLLEQDERVVLVSVLPEPALLALGRLAQEDKSPRASTALGRRRDRTHRHLVRLTAKPPSRMGWHVWVNTPDPRGSTPERRT
jgi:hypothetical protein